MDKMIECPPDAALRDCRGCKIMDACKADIREMQGRKTIEDCARCDVLKLCDAHGGSGWHHAQGVKPCKVDVWKEIVVAS
jgi:hypothetical protein